MEKQFLKAIVKTAKYKMKEGTASSYYWQDGDRILPNRLSITIEKEMSRVQKKGRNSLHEIVGQIIGRFTAKEESPLKLYKPYVVRSQIWQNEDYPQILGYGTAGISGKDGRITAQTDTNDLLIIRQDGSTITIYLFAGLGANPEALNEAMEYVVNN